MSVALVLRALGLGDLLTAVPALRALRRGLPGYQVVLATPAALAPLAAVTGAVDRVLPTSSYVRRPPGRLHWSGPPPDVAVNLHGAGPSSHRALLALHPGRLFAFACPEAGFVAGPALPPDEMHEVDRWCALLGAYHLLVEPTDLLLEVPAAGPAAVLLHPFAGAPDRCWPAERYAELARRLTRRGEHVLFTGSRAERPACAAIARAAGLPAARVTAGRTSVTQLAELVAAARLVVCGDTGVAHLATATRTPSVVLFGTMSPDAWGPRIDPDRHTVLSRGPGGLDEIGVADVHAAARDQLRSHPTDDASFGDGAAASDAAAARDALVARDALAARDAAAARAALAARETAAASDAAAAS